MNQSDICNLQSTRILEQSVETPINSIHFINFYQMNKKYEIFLFLF